MILAATAAAAASAPSFLLPDAGDSMLLVMVGLRSRPASESLRAGERDRRSKRDFLTGSVWSKRERLRGSSSMAVATMVVDVK